MKNFVTFVAVSMTLPAKAIISYQLKFMLYMIVENFGENTAEVYRRFEKKGRLAPAGLEYVSSWVDKDLKKCFQLMETDDEKLLKQWMNNWKDIVDFEVFPVITSAEATEKIKPHL